MKRAAWLPPLFLAALTGLVFCPALRYGFLYWDDVKNIVTNPHLRHFDGAALRWMWTTHFQGPYQPLSWMSLGLDFQLWALRPLGYHLTNILLHMANTALAYLLLVSLSRRKAGEGRGEGKGNGEEDDAPPVEIRVATTTFIIFLRIAIGLGHRECYAGTSAGAKIIMKPRPLQKQDLGPSRLIAPIAAGTYHGR